MPSARFRFSGNVASAEPPRTVKSSPEIMTGRPSMRAKPKIKLDGVNDRRFPSSSY